MRLCTFLFKKMHKYSPNMQEISNALFEMSPSPIAICQIVKDKILLVDANYATERIFGYRKEELIGEDIRVIMDVESAKKSRRGDFKKILFENPFGKVSLTCKAKNETTFPVEMSAKYLSDGVVIAYIKDMTEIKFIKDHLIFLEHRIHDLEIKKDHPNE